VQCALSSEDLHIRVAILSPNHQSSIALKENLHSNFKYGHNVEQTSFTVAFVVIMLFLLDEDSLALFAAKLSLNLCLSVK